MKFKKLVLFLMLIAFVVFGSIQATLLFEDIPEHIELPEKITIDQGATIESFASTNNIDFSVVENAFKLESKDSLTKPISSLQLKDSEINDAIIKALALKQEHQQKNWKKILSKFSLWFLFLGGVFYLTLKNKVNSKNRKFLYLSSVIMFGVILGADPSAMGTIKDAIVLYASSKAFFGPRFVAFIVFLILVFFANKFFCGWGCQLGTLQDLVFRLNRDKKDTKGLIKQYKVPFVIANTIRIGFFIVFTREAFIWAFDTIGAIDPFKIFKVDKYETYGIIFIAIILILSLFTYRPWCKMFCPFGLVSWFVEKISLYKISVKYDSCINCNKCVESCPSDSMSTILTQQKTNSDCYSCSTCINVCPTKSIEFKKGKRERAPIDEINTLKK